MGAGCERPALSVAVLTALGAAAAATAAGAIRLAATAALHPYIHEYGASSAA